MNVRGSRRQYSAPADDHWLRLFIGPVEGALVAEPTEEGPEGVIVDIREGIVEVLPKAARSCWHRHVVIRWRLRQDVRLSKYFS